MNRENPPPFSDILPSRSVKSERSIFPRNTQRNIQHMDFQPFGLQDLPLPANSRVKGHDIYSNKLIYRFEEAIKSEYGDQLQTLLNLEMD